MYREDWYDQTYPDPDPAQKTFYKATRPSGHDFRTGQVLYEVGKRVRPLPHVGQRSICGPGYLHASTVPGMTLVGGSWPCRLFEVTGSPAAGLSGEHRYKAGFRQISVVRELPAHWALGPNGLIVSRLIERARKITHDEADALLTTPLATSAGAAREASGAARGAAIALVSQDLITPEQFACLFQPWKQVIGEDF